MSYFTKKIIKKVTRFDFSFRKFRPKIKGFKNAFFVYSWDILEVFFSKRGLVFTFEGICLAVRKKYFFNSNASIVLMNFFNKTCIKCTFSYYYNRIFFFKINDYKRKFDFQRKSKVYFISKSISRRSTI